MAQVYVSEASDARAEFDACTVQAITDRFQAECEAVAALHNLSCCRRCCRGAAAQRTAFGGMLHAD